MSDTEEHDNLNGEPDWEKICKHVQVGDQFYWDCAARKEELEMIEEIRNEPPFEERLMQRAQDIPLPPGAAKLARAAKEGAEPKASGGLAAMLEDLATGESGKYVLAGGAIALIGLWFMFRNKSAGESSEKTGNVAWGVSLDIGGGASRKAFFSKKSSATALVTALKKLGLNAGVSPKPVEVDPAQIDAMTPKQLLDGVLKELPAIRQRMTA
jgi:hypothetical protein